MRWFNGTDWTYQYQAPTQQFAPPPPAERRITIHYGFALLAFFSLCGNCYLVDGAEGKYLITGDTMVLGDSGAWWAGYIAGISDADALAASLRLLRTLTPDVVISSAYQGDSAVTRIDAGRWPEHVDQALEGLTTAVAQPRTRYMQIASRNQFGSLR